MRDPFPDDPDALASPAYWRALAPGHPVGDDAPPPDPTLPPLDALCETLRREGYVHVEGALDAALVAEARALVEALRSRGVPLPFAFAYDAPWRLFASVGPFLAAALGDGYRALPAFWVWHVEADDEARGWGPHRDRVRATVDAEGAPASLTAWLPLTDATTLNGCMYVLPAHRDGCFARRVWDGPDASRAPALEDIRALPARAGSLLAWNQNLLHWGSRASRMGAGPRVSASMEFQRADRSPYASPWLDPRRAPPLPARLGLVAKQLQQYSHMHPLDAPLARLAERLRAQHLDALEVT